MNGCLAISLGDVTGIGPEVTLKALAQELSADDTTYLLIGDAGCLQRVNEQLDLQLDLQPYQGPSSIVRAVRRVRQNGQRKRLFFQQPGEALPAGLAPGAATAARASLAWLEDGARRCLRG